MSTTATSAFSSGNRSFGGDVPTMSTSHNPTASSDTVLAREVDPYYPSKSIRDGNVEMMTNICAMPQYKTTSPEELRLSWYINDKHAKDIKEATRMAGVHSNGMAMREWEQELSLLEPDTPERSPASSTSSLAPTRAGSPALSTSSGSTIKASRLPGSGGRTTPAVSEFGTPVLKSSGLPEPSSSQASSSKGKEKEAQHTPGKEKKAQVTPVKRFSSMPPGTREPSTPANNVTGGLWGRSVSFSSTSPASLIPPSPAAERYPTINTAERDWEAAVRDARLKKELLEQAQAAYEAAVAFEKARFQAYCNVRTKLDT
ncbi:hypothetical protein FRC04_008555 [Tulasnella sp. 424]|nr:hypothetical protein FRC04_008555 [Tulasnella sp. 424]KAG8974025.1 hypothetical protein FRC05_007941 [Tulasnella sp. 425]